MYFGMGVMTSLVAQSVGVAVGAGLNLQVSQQFYFIVSRMSILFFFPLTGCSFHW